MKWYGLAFSLGVLLVAISLPLMAIGFVELFNGLRSKPSRVIRGDLFI
jgi:hypothetical protein